jgi:hypothetical protein
MALDDPPPISERPNPAEVAHARVVRWTSHSFGVAVDYTDLTRHCMYAMGSEEAAEAEVQRLLEQRVRALP